MRTLPALDATLSNAQACYRLLGWRNDPDVDGWRGKLHWDHNFHELIGRHWAPYDHALDTYGQGFGATVEDDYSENAKSGLGPRWV